MSQPPDGVVEENEFVAGEIAFKYKQPGLSCRDLKEDILEALDKKDSRNSDLQKKLEVAREVLEKISIGDHVIEKYMHPAINAMATLCNVEKVAREALTKLKEKP